MTSDVKPCAEQLPPLGTEPTPPSDGQGQTPSLMAVLMQQARTMEAMAYTMERLTIQNLELMERLIDEPEDDAQDGPSVDMAGNPVRIS